MKKNVICLAENYDVFLVDLYGVLWNGDNFFPQALERLSKLREMGKTVIILSNYPQRAEFVESLYFRYKMFRGGHYDKMVTSGELAYRLFAGEERRLNYAVIGKSDNSVFSASPFRLVTDINKADFVYLATPKYTNEQGILVESLDLSHFQPQLDFACHLKKKFVCANPDRKSHSSGYAQMVLRPGAMADYCRNKGANIFFIGKPEKNFYDFALQETNVPKNKILMVGDALETDILGACNVGIDSALVKTGVSYDDMLHSCCHSLLEYAQSRKIIPTHILECF